jgi:adenylate cyclase
MAAPKPVKSVVLVALVWLDLRNISDTLLRRQAEDIDSLLTSIRMYYANNVVGRVMKAPGHTSVVHNYQQIDGAIPIPATLSIELARTVSEQQRNIVYRFVSDFSFANRSMISSAARSTRCAATPTHSCRKARGTRSPEGCG